MSRVARRPSRILGLVPARGGSRGIPRKNLKLLGGKPLLQWTWESARDSGVCDRIVLSSEDPEIVEAARALGMEVPFVRPAALGRDDTPMIDVVLHALDALSSEDEPPDAVLLLQPTSPLRTPEHLRQAVGLLEDHDAVCSVVEVRRDRCPHFLMRIGDGGLLEFFLPDGARYTRRQDVPPAYYRDGSVYLVRTSALRATGSIYGARCAPLVLAPGETVNLDEPDDWAAAERRLAGAAWEG